MFIKSSEILSKIKLLNSMYLSSDINYIIDDNNLYIYFKGNPLRLKICSIPETMLKRNVVIMINNPPISMTDKQYLMFNDSVKLDFKDGKVFINDDIIEDVIIVKIKIRKIPKFYFTFPETHNNEMLIYCKNNNLFINDVLIMENVDISRFKKRVSSEILSVFMGRKCYIFETKNRIYLKNLNDDYLHLDYK